MSRPGIPAELDEAEHAGDEQKLARLVDENGTRAELEAALNRRQTLLTLVELELADEQKGGAQ